MDQSKAPAEAATRENDLPRRLRKYGETFDYNMSASPGNICEEAATEIENLRHDLQKALNNHAADLSTHQQQGRYTNGELRKILKEEAEKRGINMIQLGLTDRGEEAVTAAMDRVSRPPTAG